jgi:hypothetical protein
VARPAARRRGLAGVVIVVAATLIPAVGAYASGATTIAAAPAVRPGVAVSANTSTDATAVGDDGVGFESRCWDAVEYWKLRLSAGDHVRISAQEGLGTSNLEVAVFPAGTSAATIGGTRSVKTGFPSNAPLAFTAPSTGTYPLAAGPNCDDGSNGPFTFVVAVTPGVAGARPHVR